MILVLAVALPAGWMANTIRTQRAAIAAVRAANGVIRFDYQEEFVPPGSGPPAWSRAEPPAPGWLRRWLGDELFQQPRTVYFNEPTMLTILNQVGHFEQLRLFALNSPLGAGDGKLHLDRARTLNDLGLSGAWVDDAILAEIARLPTLQTLRLHNSSATDAGFAPLAAHPRLRNLTLSSCRNLTDAGLARMLAGLPGLRYLNLSGRGPERLPRTVEALARHHPDLRSLTIDDVDLAADDLAAIGRLRDLEALGLDSPADAELVHLRSLGRLVRLRIDSPGLTDAGLAHLAGLATLERLEVFSGRITDAGLAQLHRLVNLRDLFLTRAAVTPAGVAALQRALPGLASVRTDP